MLNVILRVMRGSWFNRLLSTVMIQFSAQGAYLLLVPHGSAPIGDRALISFFRNNRMFKIKLTRFIHKGTIAETATVTNIR